MCYWEILCCTNNFVTLLRSSSIGQSTRVEQNATKPQPLSECSEMNAKLTIVKTKNLER